MIGLANGPRTSGVDERFLRQVQRIVVRPRQAQQKAVDTVLVVRYQFGKRNHIAALGAERCNRFVKCVGGVMGTAQL